MVDMSDNQRADNAGGDFQVRLEPTRPPNFVRVIMPGGDKDGPTIPVSALSTAQKDWLAAEWRRSLDAVAARQRHENAREQNGNGT